MTPARTLSADPAMESLLAFWAEAGVDAMLLDQPVDRIALGRIAPPQPPAARTPLKAAPALRPGQPDISAAVAQAQALAAQAPDLEALAAAIAAFEGCPLRFEGATRAVFSRGPSDAPLMVIGEGPGAEEDLQGAPFVGRAGQLLDKMLKAAGLADRAFITNTVFWRPPGNRTPTPSEQMICAPFVERAIALVQPKLLLLVGGASAKAMLRKDEGILALRGRWFEWRSADGNQELPAMPTLHPAFLLRQPAAKKRAWSDLLTLTERLDRPERPA
ncbi:uracil-DNA glycosylase [Phenylobacterium hankyongense]|uniref:Type-4 uracil-DNA glycosylase n=1 Tax=Phenylobacterium hankyongense TaxID=1813876 RepID=A0A328B4P1_9CAUL|nr:uracil-DNA glycosylase [Phenylobacterium hankyongense]RAK61371.1 uracil-DNA glycosylase [Phenylobacterium hankyongense]